MPLTARSEAKPVLDEPALHNAERRDVLREIGKAWAPHRTVAAWYLWRVPRERANTLK